MRMEIKEEGRLLKAGVIGLGGRGQDQLYTLHNMKDVQIAAVCDVYEDRMQEGMKLAEGAVGLRDYREMLKMPEIEVVFVFTDWLSHIPIAIDAMKAGKHVAMEVGGAASVEDCWRLVHTAEETGRECMILENCCYGEYEMAALNMIRQGKFGRIMHCEGAYGHDLREEIGYGDLNRHYRQQHFLHRNAELYPTHELGPIAQYLKLGRGNRMTSLCAMASGACGLHEWLQKNRPDTALAQAQVNEGDIVTTLIACANGETILLSHDCTLPRPYSRRNVVRGTKGCWYEDGHLLFVEGETPQNENSWMHVGESDERMIHEFRHPLWKAYDEFGQRGGHGGMDYLVLRAFVEAIQQHTPVPLDVYDTAMLMAVTPLSEQSIAMGGAPVPVPDFTGGAWIKASGEKGEGIYAI
ncbi:MAG: Gfo/Idh/MocA family oxidoreductase [Clostridiales bacterium]|nr:Gfo/Idh/MocA family oxidoreductase [Clostridiales bacterium]